MSEINFSMNEDDLNRIRKRIDGLSFKKQNSVMGTALKNVAIMTHQRLVANVSNRLLRRRTGNLAKSMQWRVATTNAGTAAYIGANVLSGRRIPYANILETGGTIRPKKSKFLTMPLPAAMTGAGVTKYPSARDYPNTFVARSDSGKLMIFQKQGKKRILPLFMLLKKVEIRPHRYLSTTLAQVKPRIFQIMNATISRELSK